MPDAIAEINTAAALVDFGNSLFVHGCGVQATVNGRHTVSNPQRDEDYRKVRTPAERPTHTQALTSRLILSGR
jgi:hypothetical protein